MPNEGHEQPKPILIALLAGTAATLMAIAALYIAMVFAMAVHAKNSGLDFGSRFLFGLFVKPLAMLFTLADQPSRQAFLASPWATALLGGFVIAVLIGIFTTMIVLRKSNAER